MRIQHNIAALNSYRNLTNNNSAVSKNLEKLSSGYRINRAGDDAAGLAISEKMRAQITGLNTAQKNAQDGVSLVQTAEGALTEVHSMLNRMVELADQSANGTYENSVDRENLQAEINSLTEEIDRIAKSTNFNGIELLDGSMAGAKTGALKISGTVGGNEITATKQAATAAVYEFDFSGKGQGDFTTKKLDGVDLTWTNDLPGTLDKFAETYNAADKDYTATVDGNKIVLTAKEKGAVTAKPTTDVTSVDADETTPGADDGILHNMDGTFQEGDSVVINGKTYKFAKDADGTDGRTFKDLATLETAAAKNGVTLDIADPANVTAKMADPGKDKSLTLQIGDTSDGFNQMTVSIADMHADALGIGNIDISTQQGAKDSIDLIRDAINLVSSTRGDLGAIQNRLEHTINNLSVTAENMTAAESRIRDVDMANEMMAYTKNNILVQSSQAMLAQANQIPQGVLVQSSQAMLAQANQIPQGVLQLLQ